MNMSRVETWWVVVTSHLLEDCSHPHIRMREWSAEAVCVLIQVSTGLGSQVPDPAAVFSVGTIKISSVSEIFTRLVSLEVLLNVPTLSEDLSVGLSTV